MDFRVSVGSGTRMQRVFRRHRLPHRVKRVAYEHNHKPNYGLTPFAFCEVRRRNHTMCAFTTRSGYERCLYSVFERMNTDWSPHPLSTAKQNP